MSTALALVPESAPVVTVDQLELVRKTVAAGATPDQLKLYLYDCARQGVHPLDKLIHFTQHKGKYTPVTSIDFMRIRAAETNEYAGSDDAVFSIGEDNGRVPHTATVTVYRLVQGQRCAFTATARWDEYKAAEDFMWRKMPHTMLAKCAEALALRKGFPRQLAGLYAKEELDQAGPTGGLVIEAPAPPMGQSSLRERETPVEPRAGDGSATSSTAPYVDDGLVRIQRIDRSPTKNPNVTKVLITFSTGEQAGTINTALANLAEQLCQDREPIVFSTKPTKWGADLVTLTRAERAIDVHADVPSDGEMPF